MRSAPPSASTAPVLKNTDRPSVVWGACVLTLLGACVGDGVDATPDGATDASSVDASSVDADFDAGTLDAEVDAGLDALVDADAGAAPAHVANEIVSAPGDTGMGFRDANNAVNGVRGGGRGTGGFDVFSLGYEVGVDDHIVLRWTGQRVTNGPGADFVVFENGFVWGGGPMHFMDPVIVEVSRDGESWVVMPHDYVAADETVYSALPVDWLGFAGIWPVLLHAEDNPVDPFDFDAAGGDAFDLEALPLDGAEAEAIRATGFSYLRLSSAPTRINVDTGAVFVRSGVSDGADIDGVIARYLVAED